MTSKMLAVRAEPWEWPILGATDPSAAALMVIDMQRDFLDPRGWFASMGFDVTALRATIDVVADLLAAARAGSGVQVIHTRQGNAGDLSDLPPAKQEQGKRFGFPIGRSGPLGRGLIRGEPGWEIVPEVSPLLEELVVDKPGFSAFVGTDLEDELLARSVRSLIITGVTANVCVLSTLLEAVDRGYDCLVVTDAIAGADPAAASAICDLVRYQGGLFGCLAPARAVTSALRGIADG